MATKKERSECDALAPPVSHVEARRQPPKAIMEECAAKPPSKGLEHLVDIEHVVIEQKIQPKKGELFQGSFFTKS